MSFPVTPDGSSQASKSQEEIRSNERKTGTPMTPRTPRTPRTPGWVSSPRTPIYSPTSLFFPSDDKGKGRKGSAARASLDFNRYADTAGLTGEEKFTYFLHGKLGQLSEYWMTHFILLVALILYALLGGLLFKLLEGKNDSIETKDLFEGRGDLVTSLRGLTPEFLPLDTKKQLAAFNEKAVEHMRKYEASIVDCINHNSKMDRGLGELNWHYWPSVYFCTTIFTTIGYGHIAPETIPGRILAIVYAMFGIPLFLTVLADFGKLLTRIIKFGWVFVRRAYYTGSCRKIRRAVQETEIGEKMGITSADAEPTTIIEVDDKFNLPITLALIVLLIYLFVGAICFFRWEAWSFLESFYFVFISMSTIGFGDYVPQNQQNMFVSMVYIAFGLALTSMCINVVQETLEDTFAEATAKIQTELGVEEENKV